MRIPIQLQDRMITVVLKMAENNMDALKIISIPVLRDATKGGRLILNLDEMNMRGDQIVEAFKHCKGNLDAFMAKVDRRDAAMIEAVNLAQAGSGEVAVQWGGSRRATPEVPGEITETLDRTRVGVELDL
jgi:hypothetical protein